MKTVWYRKPWGVIVAILIWPLFIVWYAWAKASWSKGVKVFVTATASLFLVFALSAISYEEPLRDDTPQLHEVREAEERSERERQKEEEKLKQAELKAKEAERQLQKEEDARKKAEREAEIERQRQREREEKLRLEQEAAQQQAQGSSTSNSQETVHPGAFCSPMGATGITSTGTPMACKTSPTDSRARWRKM